MDSLALNAFTWNEKQLNHQLDKAEAYVAL